MLLDFIYDESGKPFALVYTNGTATPVTYYYVLNLQGDVVGLIDASGEWVAKYAYNAWGEILSVTNTNGVAITSSTHIANLNPLRYRGYYYDIETGFYYLQSRYYDPVTHRFINPDATPSTGQGTTGTNMFVYCGNNPVRRIDILGRSWLEDIWDDFTDWVADEILDPLVNEIEEEWAEEVNTFSIGQSVTAVSGEFMVSAQIAIAMDSEGNILLYTTESSGHSTGTPGVSCTTDFSVTDAPTVDYFLGECETYGSSAGFNVWYIPASVGQDIAFLGEEEQYICITNSTGVGSRGFEVHGIYSIGVCKESFNLFEYLRGLIDTLR